MAQTVFAEGASDESDGLSFSDDSSNNFMEHPDFDDFDMGEDDFDDESDDEFDEMDEE